MKVCEGVRRGRRQSKCFLGSRRDFDAKRYALLRFYTSTAQSQPKHHCLPAIMVTPNNATPGDDERLKAALWHSIGKTIDAIAIEQNINASPTFIAGVTEMASAKINTIAADLEAFARHADRSIVNERDALLLARHNDSLKDVLQAKAEELRKREKSTTR